MKVHKLGSGLLDVSHSKVLNSSHFRRSHLVLENCFRIAYQPVALEVEADLGGYLPYEYLGYRHRIPVAYSNAGFITTTPNVEFKQPYVINLLCRKHTLNLLIAISLFCHLVNLIYALIEIKSVQKYKGFILMCLSNKTVLKQNVPPALAQFRKFIYVIQ